MFSTEIVDRAKFFLYSPAMVGTDVVRVAYWNAGTAPGAQTFRLDTPIRLVPPYDATSLGRAASMANAFLNAVSIAPGLSAQVRSARFAFDAFNTSFTSYTGSAAEYFLANRVWGPTLPEAIVSKWRAVLMAFVGLWNQLRTVANAVLAASTTTPARTAVTTTIATATSGTVSAPRVATTPISIPNVTQLGPAAQAAIVSQQRASDTPSAAGPATIATTPDTAPTAVVTAVTSTVATGSTPALATPDTPTPPEQALDTKLTDKPWFWPVVVGSGVAVLMLAFSGRK